MKRTFKLYILCALALICLNSCKKLIEVDTPPNQLVTKAVFSDSTSSLSALLNIYSLFDNTIDANYTLYTALYSDELNYPSSGAQSLEFLHSSVSSNNSSDLTIWKNYYFIIYSCNDLINNLHVSNNLSLASVNQFKCEAKFLRAYAYFYLTNLYGGVPLILETDVNVTANAAKSDSTTVYNQIKQDLQAAETGLSVNYIGSGKVRVSQFAATALLARIYLYQRDWSNAEAEASKVINSGLYSPLENPANVFLANSKEAILQFWTQNGFINTAPQLIPISGIPAYPLTTNLKNAFESGDIRFTNWVKSTTVSNVIYYYPYKYHNRIANMSAPEYLMALRLGEQYLIRAEARAMQNNITGAQSDLNTIRARAHLPVTTANTALTLVNAVLHERQIELFSEWGHHILDLKRLGQANSVLGSYKPTWKRDTSLLLPIPQNEINTDPNLKQNQGY
jgi:hypothetical protein